MINTDLSKLFCLLLCLSACSPSSEDYTRYVDPLIGSADHGHVFVGANRPFGMLQLGPVNLSQGWDWCSGYHYSDTTIIGFAHTHLSGTGIGDLGDILVMPLTGAPQWYKGRKDEPEAGYLSTYSHSRESTAPGYYAVHLDKYGIDVALTATERAGHHRYRFPAGSQAHIMIDLKEGIGWDRVTENQIRQIDAQSFEGFRYSTGWAKDQKIYFYGRLSKPMQDFVVQPSYWRYNNRGDSVLVHRALCSFAATGETIDLQLGISYVSCENAKENLEAEMPDWDFDARCREARQAWNTELSKIAFRHPDPSVMCTFYTALYHLCFAPTVFQDRNGDYRGADGQVHHTQEFTPYTVFSLWDTYRAAHPLFTLLQPERVNDFVRSMMAIYEQQGRLPVWHLVGNETDCMVGYHSVPVMVDAYFKGFRDYDVEKAFEAMKATALRRTHGLDYVQDLGYIPADKTPQSVAMGLEYAIDDACIMALAVALGHEEDAALFARRALAYRHYFDRQTQFMRGRLADGSWRTPFDPLHSLHLEDDYTEGNAWQYTWLVPHDLEGLVELFGGREAFLHKLDSLFILPSELNEGASADISGLIGQYAHGNEPGHATLYLYTLAGAPHKAAERVRQVMTQFYTDQPSGLAGNEDCGQMSAWYIFSALGFYPVHPANGEYVFGSPLVHEALLPLPNGKSFRITAKNNSPENIYIQSIELNGQPYRKAFIRHQDIVLGGELVYYMGPTPPNS